MVATELLVAVWTAHAAVTTRYGWWDLFRFVTLALGATAYLVATREPEERRRNAHPRGEHVDQTSVWLFASALVLPVPLVVALVVLMRIQRYMIARRNPAKFIFTSASIAASALAVQLVAASTPLHGWLTGSRPLPRTAVESVVAGLVVAACVAAYFVVQAVLVGGARGMIHGGTTVRDLIGSRATNLDILTTLGLAVCAGILNMISPVLALVMVPIVVQWSRREQKLNQAEIDKAQLANDAWHDVLTGLPNRRGFNAPAQVALLSDQLDGKSTTLLFIDLDNLKLWNDLLLHVSADQILEAIARTVRTCTRDGDLLCRWGGEEYLALLPDTDLVAGAALAERIRAAVEMLEVEVTLPAGGATVRVGPGQVEGRRTMSIRDGQGCTVSVGVAGSPQHGTDLQQLLAAGGKAMKAAKDSGRNRVFTLPADQDGLPDSARRDIADGEFVVGSGGEGRPHG